AGLTCRRHRWADPVRLSRARSGDAAVGPRRRHPRRERQPPRLSRRELHRRLPLQLRPGDVPGARLRRALLADAARPGGAAPGSLRTAGGMKWLPLAAALGAPAAVSPWGGGRLSAPTRRPTP